MTAFSFGSSPVVAVVLCTLVALSVVSWGIIFGKWRQLRYLSFENRGFYRLFLNARSMEEVNSNIDRYPQSQLAYLFKSGFLETSLMKSSPSALNCMQRTLERETAKCNLVLEKNLNILATIASSAPFIGLFGTVWGIMTSFRNIGTTGSASLAIVAPGISEALIATAIGLGAAIPAAILFNYFHGRVRESVTELENFSRDMLNVAERSLSASEKK